MMPSPMSPAPWRSPLERALDANRSLAHARYLQLATVRTDGRPANRTVVFRGFLADTNQLTVVTDARSEKIQQIRENDWGEACWYFADTREQFRLSGRLTLVTADSPDSTLQTARERSWQALSDAARTQFTWADPGKPRRDEMSGAGMTSGAIAPLSHFCLLLLNPSEVDHLDLRSNPHNRWHYSSQGDIWTVEAINP